MQTWTDPASGRPFGIDAEGRSFWLDEAQPHPASDDVEPDPYGLFSRTTAAATVPARIPVRERVDDHFPGADPFPGGHSVDADPNADPNADPFGLDPFPVPATRTTRTARSSARRGRTGRGGVGRTLTVGVLATAVLAACGVGAWTLFRDGATSADGTRVARTAATASTGRTAGTAPQTAGATAATVPAGENTPGRTAGPVVTQGAGTEKAMTAPGAIRYTRIGAADWKAVLQNPNAYAGWTIVVHGFATRNGGRGSTLLADVDGVPHGKRTAFTAPAVLTASGAMLATVHKGDGFQAWVQVVGTRTVKDGGRTVLAPVLQVNKIVVTVPAR